MFVPIANGKQRAKSTWSAKQSENRNKFGEMVTFSVVYTNMK